MTVFIKSFSSLNKAFSGYYLLKHSVSTSSSLVTVFNTKPGPRIKLNIKKNVGLFGREELQSYDGFYLMKENASIDAERLIDEACDSQRKRKVVDVFDELSDTLCQVADLAEFVRLGHPEPNFSKAAEDACISISGLVERLNTNKRLYNALKEVYEKGDNFEITPLERHVAGLFLFDFEQCGIHLDEKHRHQVVELNNYILQMGQRFMAGAQDARMIQADNIPADIRHHFSVSNNLVVVSSLHTDSDIELIREAIYKIFLLPDKNQDYLLNELLICRHKLADICGFPTYAHRALKSSLAETPDMVKDFLSELNKQLRPLAEKDFETLHSLKKDLDPSCGSLQVWDVPYLKGKMKRDWYDIQSKDYMSYFSLGTCMKGLSDLMGRLYGISLVNEKIEHGEVWSPDVYKLAVTHETEGILGHIYCDFYERTEKPNQDCHFTIRCGRELPDGSYQTPIVVVMLNLWPPRWGSPCLLTMSMLENLFHEMGHAMHSMLGRTKHQHVSGTRCSTDFAEVPSILMEYFANDPRVIEGFAEHFSTGEKIPHNMAVKLCSTKKLLAASDMQLQLFYSMLDQKFHSEHPLKGPTIQVLAETQNEFYYLPYIQGSAWHLRFSHLVGYGAKYYSYLMSRAVASWIWHKNFSNEPLNREAGERYRHGVLAHGGSKPVRQLLADFLQVEVTPAALAKALIQDINVRPSATN